MPGMCDQPIFEVMELVKRDGDGLSRRGDAEHFALMGAGDLSPHPGASLGTDNFMDRDVNVRKRREELLHHRLEAVWSRSLAGSQRNILPVGCDGFIEQIRVLLGEGSVQGLDGAHFGLGQ